MQQAGVSPVQQAEGSQGAVGTMGALWHGRLGLLGCSRLGAPPMPHTRGSLSVQQAGGPQHGRLGLPGCGRLGSLGASGFHPLPSAGRHRCGEAPGLAGGRE